MNKLIVKPQNALKEALQRRQQDKLSSNFTYKMMQQVYQEELKMRKYRSLIDIISLSLALGVMFVLGVLFVLFFTDFSFDTILFSLQNGWGESCFVFYIYISALVLLLLGVDHLICKRRRKNDN